MKRVYQNILGLMGLILLVLPLMAQDASKGQFAGYIIEKKGKKKEGIIELHMSYPWENQRSIKFIPKKVWEKNDGDVKKKHKEKFKAKDLDGYGYDGREFVTMKYTSLGDGTNTSPNKFTGAMGALGNLSKNQHMVEQLLSGKVDVYRFYNYPPDMSVQVGSEESAEYNQMINELKNKPDALVKKGKKGKVKSFKGMLSFKKYIGDCEIILNKFENNEYLRKKSIFDANGVSAADEAIEIFTDYNKECGK